MIALDFDLQYRYDLTPSGIVVPVELVFADQRIAFPARLDTGSSDCIFDRSFAELLGINVESGYQRNYRTVAGTFSAFGHDVTLRTQGLEWSAMVFFYAASDPDANFSGPSGLARSCAPGLIHYDQTLYLAPFAAAAE